ncbi:MerR family transcriptional regulator, partial [Streptomyces durbertensis]|nr:MerR family transcriptional regulator [Streptomyces durbertensis]
LTQALAGIPGPQAAATLTTLTQDTNPAVAHTATYLLHLREPH